MSGTDTKDESIQRQILQAAQQLFQAHGVQKVTMDDVAREIGKGRSSLYYYYKSKDEILDAAIALEMQDIIAEISAAVEQEKDVEQKIVAYCLTRLKISQKRRAFNNAIDNIRSSDELTEYMSLRKVKQQRFRQQETPLLRQILNDSIAKKQLRSMSVQEQDAVIALILNSIQGFKKEMLNQKSMQGLKPGIAMLARLIVQGFKK